MKQSHVRLEQIVPNERLSLLTARFCGIDVPENFVLSSGGLADSEILFAVKRYDRVISGSANTISGLPVPFRLHQEDFAQALGIPSSGKYEPPGGQYLSRMFSLLRMHSADPVSDMYRLWDQIIFCYLIGNTDTHVKNLSLLYSADLRSMRLAPAYDIVSTVIYPSATRELSFRIGNTGSIDEVREDSFRKAARDAGIGEKAALKRYHDMISRFVPSLQKAVHVMQSEGFSDISDIARRIKDHGGIKAALGK